MPVNVAWTKAFFLNVGMIVGTAFLIFLISSDTFKICGKASDKGIGMKGAMGASLQKTTLDLNPVSAGICQSLAGCATSLISSFVKWGW